MFGMKKSLLKKKKIEYKAGYCLIKDMTDEDFQNAYKILSETDLKWEKKYLHSYKWNGKYFEYLGEKN